MFFLFHLSLVVCRLSFASPLMYIKHTDYRFFVDIFLVAFYIYTYRWVCDSLSLCLSVLFGCAAALWPFGRWVLFVRRCWSNLLLSLSDIGGVCGFRFLEVWNFRFWVFLFDLSESMSVALLVRKACEDNLNFFEKVNMYVYT